MMETIGPYQLLDKIGAGGMGTVFRARHTESGRVVALKVMRADLSQDTSFIRRFKREASIVSGLDSPHIVRVLDIGEEGANRYIAMELVDGESLAAVLRSRGALSVEEAIDIATQVAEALVIAGEQGIVHRDVSPPNILITEEGIVKLADFGIARSQTSATLTGTGTFIGKPTYSAPETFDGRADIRSDIYALGVVLFEMLSGRPPFIGPTPVATMDLHVRHPCPRLADLGIRVPISVEQVLDRCLKKDPRERFQSPALLLAALRSVFAADAATETATIALTSDGERGSGSRHSSAAGMGGRGFRFSSIAALGAFGAVAAVAIVAYGIVSAGGGSSQPNTSPPSVQSDPTAPITAAPTVVTTTQTPGSDHLQQRLQSVLQELPSADSAFLYKDLQTGETVVYGDQRQIPSASTIKTVIALEAERQVEVGMLDWGQSLTVQQSDIVGGTGILQNEVGQRLTLHDLVDTMLAYSDNTAGNMLTRLLGGFTPINSLANALQLPDTRMQRFFLDFDARNRGLENYTSVTDLVSLLGQIEKGQAVSTFASAHVLARLANRQTSYPSWSGRDLPAGSIAGTINGVLPGERIEASILQLQQGRRGILAVALVNQGDEQAAEQQISRTVGKVFEMLNLSPPTSNANDSTPDCPQSLPNDAATFPLPLDQPTRSIIAALNCGNATVIAAIASGSVAPLAAAWTGAALADYQGQVSKGTLTVQRPTALQVVAVNVGADGQTATATTVETWSVNGGATRTYDETYELLQNGARWLISKNVYTAR